VLQKEDDDWIMKCMEYEVKFWTDRKTKEDLERRCRKGLSSTYIEHGRCYGS